MSPYETDHACITLIRFYLIRQTAWRISPKIQNPFFTKCIGSGEAARGRAVQAGYERVGGEDQGGGDMCVYSEGGVPEWRRPGVGSV